MDRGLYIAMTGAKHNMLAQTNHANNLANLNTTGFKADFAQARSMGVYYGDGHPTRAYALTENPATDFRPGSLQETGRELDIAIEGDGFIAVQAPDGTEAYTRAGNLTIDAAGILRTGNGLPVMGNGGPVAIPPNQKVEIGSDGTISVRLQGQGPEVLAEVNRIKLVNPDLTTMDKFEDGLLRPREGGELAAAADVTVASGFLETSNVNAIDAFTEMLSLARQYEMSVKMMQQMEQKSESSARLLQMQ